MSADWRVLEAGEGEPRTSISLGRFAIRIKAVAEDVHVRMGLRRARRRMRRALSHLDDYTLRDIGISRAELGHDAGDLRGIAALLALLTDLRPH